MTFVVGTITRCSGQNHYNVPVTVGGQTYTITVDQSELQTDISDRDEARQKIIDRLRSAKKEAGAGNFAQTRAALEGKTFQI